MYTLAFSLYGHHVAASLSYIRQVCASIQKIYDAHFPYTTIRSATSWDACVPVHFKNSPANFVLPAVVDVSAAQSAPQHSFRAGQVGASRERLGGHNLVGGATLHSRECPPALYHTWPCTHTHTYILWCRQAAASKAGEEEGR